MYSNGTFTTLDVPRHHFHLCRQHQRERPGGGFLLRWLWPLAMVSCTATARSRPSMHRVPLHTLRRPASTNSGQVAGCYHRDGSRYPWFRVQQRHVHDPRCPGAIDTSAASINASGQVTGYYCDGSRASMVSCTATARSRPSMFRVPLALVPLASTIAARWRVVTSDGSWRPWFRVQQRHVHDPRCAGCRWHHCATSINDERPGDGVLLRWLGWTVAWFHCYPDGYPDGHSHPEPMGAAVGRRVAGRNGFAGPSPADPPAAGVVAIGHPQLGRQP